MSGGAEERGAGDRGAEDEREALAAEYVLGTLSGAEAEAVARAMAGDAGLSAAVERWEWRLAPLSRLAAPGSPPPELWGRIEARIGDGIEDGIGDGIGARPGAVGARGADAVAVGRGWVDRAVRWWAAGATAAAVAMAAVLVLAGPGGSPPLATAMVGDRTQPAWTAWADGEGALHVAAVTAAAGTPPVAVPAGRVLQLWALPPGATAPTSLAVLSPGQTGLVLVSPAVRPVPGMLIELTLEPAGGSPLPRPSGPVQFIGRLFRAA